MAEKMKGVIAELKTYLPDGTEIDSKFEFRPYCDWFIEKLHDGYASTKYEDIGAIIDDFGIDVAERVVKGEIVEVERETPEDFRLVSCREKVKYVKRASKIVYPWRDAMREYLIREF